MGLALVMVEENAGRAVQLADNDPLGAVDHESPAFRHQGDLAEIDFLLLDVADQFLLAASIRVKNYKPDHDFKGCGISHALLNTLLYIVFHVSDLVIDKLQRTFPAEVLYRENAFKSALKADIPALVRIGIHLEKLVVRLPLDFDQVGNIHDFPDMSKIFPYLCHSSLRYGL